MFTTHQTTSSLATFTHGGGSPARVATAYTTARSSADWVDVLDLCTFRYSAKPVGEGQDFPRLVSKAFGIKGPGTLSSTSSSSKMASGIVGGSLSSNSHSHHSLPSPPTRPPRLAPDAQQELIIDRPTRKPTSPSRPVAGESFWRWSHNTPSTVDTYAPTELHFPASHSPGDSEGRPMEARSTYYSDFSAGSTVPDVNDLAILPTIFKRGQALQPVMQNQEAARGLTSIPEAPSSTHSQEQQETVHSQPRDIPEKDRKRSSAGTFGPKNGKYPSIYSINSSNASPERHIASNIYDIPRAANQTKRRPLSYSSTSASPQRFATPKAADDTAAVARRRAMGMTSPSDRADHREPESESQIEDYLRRQSKCNQRRIAPASSPAPTSGFGFESAVDLNDDLEDKMKKSKKEFRKSKVDQMLGEGAEYARMTMELNRATLRKAFDGPVKQTQVSILS